MEILGKNWTWLKYMQKPLDKFFDFFEGKHHNSQV
jgi:hypothetical protein